MTPFEFVFGLTSVMTSLALTHLVTGLVALVRHGDKVRYSWRHAAWTFQAFNLVVANWASFWRSRDIISWPVHMILIDLAFVISLYAYSALVIPEIVRDERLDLRVFHEQQGRRYIAAELVFTILALVKIALSTDTVVAWLKSASFGLLATVLSVSALVVRPAWAQRVIAGATVVLSVISSAGCISQRARVRLRTPTAS